MEGNRALPAGGSASVTVGCFEAAGLRPVLLAPAFMLEPHLGGWPSNTVTFAPTLAIAADNRSFTMTAHQRRLEGRYAGHDIPGAIHAGAVCITRP